MVAMASTALHPCHKKLRFFTAAQREAISKFLSDEIEKLRRGNNEDTQTNEEDHAAKKPCIRKEDSDLKFLKGHYYEDIEDDCFVDEIQQYFTDKPSNIKPLEYWKIHESRYPYLSQIARNLLCIPATSTPAERVFFCSWKYHHG